MYAAYSLYISIDQSNYFKSKTRSRICYPLFIFHFSILLRKNNLLSTTSIFVFCLIYAEPIYPTSKPFHGFLELEIG